MTPPEPDLQFELRVAADDESAGQEALEEFATGIRDELANIGVERVEQLPANPAPSGSRAAAEIYGAVQLAIGVVNTLDRAVKAIQVIRRWAVRYARRLRVTVSGTEVDLAEATDEQVEQIAQNLLPRPAKLSAPVGVRRALIVANEQYDDPALAQLRSPTQDAEALAGVLADPAIGGFDVETLVDADERTVRRRVAEHFAGGDRDDLLLLHFSCHGVKDLRGRLHLAARDTTLALLEATSVPASFLHDQMSQAQSGRVVLILDCCYSGAFGRGSVVRAGTEVGNEFGDGNGRVVLTASSATEYAFEDGELSRAEGLPSVFTAALVHGLRTGEADLDADGEISINDLYDYAYRAVQERTPGQAPTKWSFGIQGRLVIAYSPRPATLPATIRDDLASERVPLRLAGVEALAELLAGDKPGMRAAAQRKLAELCDADDSMRVRRAADEALNATPTPAEVSDRGADSAGAQPETSATGRPSAPPGEPTPTMSTPGTARRERLTRPRRRALAALGAVVAAALAASLAIWLPRDTEDGSPGGVLTGERIEVAVVNWPEGIAASYLMGRVFEDEGATVEYQFADHPSVFRLVATGQADLGFNMWLPVTHQELWDRHQADLEDLGTWYDGAGLAIAVNEDAPVRSLAELGGAAAEFDRQITGIEPDTNLMQVVQDEVIPAYGLDDMELVPSSIGEMLAELAAATTRDEHIVVTLWRPHWAYTAYPIRDLTDPQGVFTDYTEEIHSFARDGLSKDLPAAVELVQDFQLTEQQLADLMEIMFVDRDSDTSSDYAASVDEWLEANPSWVDQLRAAGELP